MCFVELIKAFDTVKLAMELLNQKYVPSKLTNICLKINKNIRKKVTLHLNLSNKIQKTNEIRQSDNLNNPTPISCYNRYSHWRRIDIEFGVLPWKALNSAI